MVIQEKKSQTYSERNEAKREQFLDKLKNISPSTIVYVDESGMNDNDFYPYAYSCKGKRFYEAHPGHYKKRLSMIGGLCKDQFQAPFIFEGHCNTQVFEAYVANILVPSLQPGTTVIIDNASFHRSSKIQTLIESANCRLLFLPPYSPDLNPIEKWWHKIKNSIRKLRRASELNLEDAMGEVLSILSTD